jgi:hypothetical protein
MLRRHASVALGNSIFVHGGLIGNEPRGGLVIAMINNQEPLQVDFVPADID